LGLLVTTFGKLAMKPSEQIIISVKEARKLLGKEFAYLSDDEVERMIALLENIAREFIQNTVPQF
jgi:hypothetical protein